ncbi:hypothetical protein [Citrifermentans bremense]|nr:hypothetical protein [Citrifermentans bremense]
MKKAPEFSPTPFLYFPADQQEATLHDVAGEAESAVAVVLGKVPGYQDDPNDEGK